MPRFASRLVDRLGPRLFEMRAAHVLEIVDALGSAGVRVWLAGGWGVDALLGHQARRHRDLDLVVDAGDGSEERARRVLQDLGYRTVVERAPSGKWMPHKAVLRDAGGRRIDLLPVRLDGGPLAPRSHNGPGANGFVPAGLASGAVAGRRVGCLAASVQLAFHGDYDPTGVDRHDVALLCSRFDLPPPPGYS